MNTSSAPIPAPSSRRDAIKKLGLGAMALGGLGVFMRTAPAQTSNAQDIAVLNFALNLEYLEAEYYLYGTTGRGLEGKAGLDGTGAFGQTRVKNNPRVRFETRAFRDYAREIARDELNHVNFLRAAITSLGGTPVARPAIDLRASFDAAAKAAGIGNSFDPFADEVSFLLGAFVFEDVGVTAYKGAAPLIDSAGVLEAAAGILAVEAYHAGSVRTVLFSLGKQVQSLAAKISRLRDNADGPADLDQGITLRGGRANIVPTDKDGLAYSRTTRQVLNIVYLAPNATSGGFFPNGLNGAIR